MTIFEKVKFWSSLNAETESNFSSSNFFQENDLSLEFQIKLGFRTNFKFID